MDLIIVLGVTGGFMLLFGIGGLITDYIMPKIELLEQWISTLPLMQKGGDAKK